MDGKYNIAIGIDGVDAIQENLRSHSGFTIRYAMKLGFGDVGAYDFFEYGDAAYDAVASPEHTMALYSAKLRAYLEAESAKPQSAAERSPFLFVAALQSMHVRRDGAPRTRPSAASRASLSKETHA